MVALFSAVGTGLGGFVKENIVISKICFVIIVETPFAINMNGVELLRSTDDAFLLAYYALNDALSVKDVSTLKLEGWLDF